ncbi:hypothetical protein [Luteibacter sp. dw_328]|uniref:hypothetical protein n=1 Tax=Luteibacter sp. dw_328 TaxID=2719796 RepID=UPI001BD25EBD|nr:hypothetical protein [Luteibacter sp. dw_328]
MADAAVRFEDRANVLAGESDTGKSYLVHCLDYIFGADAMKKRFKEVDPYSQLFVEFENHEGKLITLERSLSGGDLLAYRSSLSRIGTEAPLKVAAKRSGKSKALDVTQILFEFSGVKEAKVRKNDRGDVVRLTVRTLLPLFLVDEISVIAEQSPVLGRASYDKTARKRGFAYVLSGKDDGGVVSTEVKDVVDARLAAQISVVTDLLEPLERRVQDRLGVPLEESVEAIDEEISTVYLAMSSHSDERKALEGGRAKVVDDGRRADSQLVAIDELLNQYRLLDERYGTDLSRLDFIAEGSHFFEGLQEVNCPVCDQVITPGHVHTGLAEASSVYEAASAEAAKILAHKADLAETTATLMVLRSVRLSELATSKATLHQIDATIDETVAPAMQDAGAKLELLVGRRLGLEKIRLEELQVSDLRARRDELERLRKPGNASSGDWERISSSATRSFCLEVEAVLKEWRWEGVGRVEFDETEYDILVDGQRRQSHGKGVRAVLYAAFVVGLLRYCHANGRPFLGPVIVDSPLTSYKKSKVLGDLDEPINVDIEAAFWASLKNIKAGTQLIIIENKEPPQSVADAVHYEWFAGKSAKAGERAGFIP